MSKCPRCLFSTLRASIIDMLSIRCDSKTKILKSFFIKKNQTHLESPCYQMQKCDSWCSVLRHPAVSFRELKSCWLVRVRWGCGGRWYGWVLNGWVRGWTWSMFETGGTFCMLVKDFCLFIWLGFSFLWDSVSSLAKTIRRSCSVDQAGLKHTRNPPASACQVLGLRVCTTNILLSRFLLKMGGYRLTVRATWALRTHGNC